MLTDEWRLNVKIIHVLKTFTCIYNIKEARNHLKYIFLYSHTRSLHTAIAIKLFLERANT